MFVRRILVRWLCKPRLRCCTTRHDRPPSTHAHICAPTMPRGVRRTALASSGASAFGHRPRRHRYRIRTTAKWLDADRQVYRHCVCTHSLWATADERAVPIGYREWWAVCSVTSGRTETSLPRPRSPPRARTQADSHATPCHAKPLQRANVQRANARPCSTPTAPASSQHRPVARERVRACVCLSSRAPPPPTSRRCS